MAGSQTNIRHISSFRKMPEGSFFTSGNNFFFILKVSSLICRGSLQ